MAAPGGGCEGPPTHARRALPSAARRRRRPTSCGADSGSIDQVGAGGQEGRRRDEALIYDIARRPLRASGSGWLGRSARVGGHFYGGDARFP